MSKPNQPDQHTLANKQVHAKKKPRAHDEGEVAIRERGKDRDSSGSDNEGAADDVDLQPVSVVDDPSILRIGIMADSVSFFLSYNFNILIFILIIIPFRN